MNILDSMIVGKYPIVILLNTAMTILVALAANKHLQNFFLAPFFFQYHEEHSNLSASTFLPLPSNSAEAVMI